MTEVGSVFTENYAFPNTHLNGSKQSHAMEVRAAAGTLDPERITEASFARYLDEPRRAHRHARVDPRRVRLDATPNVPARQTAGLS